MWSILKDTVFNGATDSEMISLIVVANAYGLNPLTRELFAFPNKRGGIVPVVSIDGWCRIINSSKLLDGFEFEWDWTDKAKGVPFSCTCIMYVKGRDHPVKITELFSECKRPSDAWNNMSCRMLRHKALIQAARYAFGFAGIYDEDEARDIVGSVSVTSEQLPPPEIPGSSSFEVESHVSEAEVDDAPPGAEPPVEKEKAAASEPAQEELPATKTEPPAPQKKTGKAAFQTVVSLCKKDQVSTIELLAWAKETNVAEPNAKTLSDMEDQSFSAIIKNWAKVLEQIKVMREGGAE